MAGGNPEEGRQVNDVYDTPGEVTMALCAVETFIGAIHEGACGRGAMAKVLESVGYKVIGTDLEPRGYGFKADIFKLRRALAPNFVTNPPFAFTEPAKLDAEDLINHVLAYLKPVKMALLLKATYWHAAGRQNLFNLTRPARVYPLTWRPDFLGKGRPTMECSWMVWDVDHTGPTQYIPLARPKTTALVRPARNP